MSAKTIYIDESGDFGKRGRYFTIAGAILDDEDRKKQLRKISQSMRDAKKANPEAVSVNGEIKAANIGFEGKQLLLQKLSNRINFTINYITADLHHSYGQLETDQNIFYNYLTRYLIKPIVTNDAELVKLTIVLDMRNSAVKKARNFDDYIKAMIWGEWERPDVEVEVVYQESQNSNGLQLVDYVANAINGYYLYNKDDFASIIRRKIVVRQHFPYRKFGK